MFVPAKATRYFGVPPGRRLFRTAQASVARLWALATARVRLTRVVLSACAREWVETLRLEREAALTWRGREQALRSLGEAVYHARAEETEQAKTRVVELDRQLLRLGARARRLQEERQGRIERAWREDGPTVIEPPPVEPPGPVIVPEPEPIPHEPPGPIIVPEPGPVPHEPPGPVVVPEPQPPQPR